MPVRPWAGLRGQLLVASLVFLLIPWLGFKTLQASRDFLFKGQAQAQLLTARGIATVFDNHTELFEQLPKQPSDYRELALYSLDNSILVDGHQEDWNQLWRWRQRVGGAGTGFELLLGHKQGQLFGIVKVTDSTPVGRHPAYLRLDRSDHLRLYFKDSNDTIQRLLFSFEGSGPVAAYPMDEQWRYALRDRPDYQVRSHLQMNDVGYVLEFALPLNWLGAERQLALVVADVASPQNRHIAELVGSLPQINNGSLNFLVARSEQTEAILDGMAPQDKRIWILDRKLHVKAIKGRLEKPRALTGTSDGSWRSLLRAVREYMANRLVGIHSGEIRDHDPTGTVKRQDQVLQHALAGKPGVVRRASHKGHGEVIAAAWPIKAGADIIGVALVEQSTREVLSLQRAQLERLLGWSVAGIGLALLVMLGLAARLTLRIRRLGNEAINAIDGYGRMQHCEITSEQQSPDEIGELARSFNQVLQKLHGYQQFLVNIPRTLRHEINNPLNTISTSLDQLASSGADRAQLDGARRALARISLLVEKLGEAASLEDALRNEASETIELSHLVNQYASNRMRRNQALNIHVTTPDKPVFIDASDLHIEQLLDKLIDNAADFALPATVIELALVQHKQAVRLSVINQGPALDPADDRLFQLMHSKRQRGSGEHFGLGLYVARVITEFHGGSISANNLPGGRVCFCVTLAPA